MVTPAPAPVVPPLADGAPGRAWIVGWTTLIGASWVVGNVVGLIAIGVAFGGEAEAERLRDTTGFSGYASVVLRSVAFDAIIGASAGFGVGLVTPLLLRGRLPHGLLVAGVVAAILVFAEVLGHLGWIVSTMFLVLFELLLGDGDLSRASVVWAGGILAAVITALTFGGLSSIALAQRVPRVEWWFLGISIGLIAGELPVILALVNEAGTGTYGALSALLKPLIVALASGYGMWLALRPARSASEPTS